jgi:hypothetical protein
MEDEELWTLLRQIVQHPRFSFVNKVFHHVDLSRFIITKWVIELYDEPELNFEFPHTRSFEGSFRSVITEAAEELKLTQPNL